MREDSKNPLAAGGAFVLCLWLNGCCSAPEDKFSMPVAPDYSCRTGGDGGYDFYVWDCYENRRVVIYRFTAWASCREPQMEIAACGATTRIEEKVFYLGENKRLDKNKLPSQCRGETPPRWQTKQAAR